MIGRAETVNESEDEARRVAVPQGSEPACLAPRLLSSGRSDLIYGHVVVDGGHPGVEHRVRAWVLGRAAAAAPFASTCAGRLGADLVVVGPGVAAAVRSEEHTSELQSLMRISYAVFCLKKKKDDHRHVATLLANNTTRQTTLLTHTIRQRRYLNHLMS